MSRPFEVPIPLASDTWLDWAQRLVRALRIHDLPTATQALPTYPKSRLPKATPAGHLIYVTDEAGGAVPAFSDGTNWRRVTDRAIVS